MSFLVLIFIIILLLLLGFLGYNVCIFWNVTCPQISNPSTKSSKDQD
jgi:hypothetical protein